MSELYSYGKINLFLDITGCYKNGYHRIRSLFCETSLSDVLFFERNTVSRVRVFDKLNILPEDNLLKKAADKMEGIIKKIPFGVDFLIEKRIPIGGGMGGGSSNAATVLKVLNRIWNINFSEKKLQEIGKTLGADVPFFIKGGIQKVTGIGEILNPVSISNTNLNILLIIPDVSVSTLLAYRMIDKNNLSCTSYENEKRLKKLILGLRENDYNLITNNIFNKFEVVVFEEYPVLGKIKVDMIKSGADVSFMSGSGSTMVAIYNNRKKLEEGEGFLNRIGYKTIEIKLRQ